MASEDLCPDAVWLASYPRSGNTLLRIIVRDCFGLFVGSIYDDFKWSDTLPEIVGYSGESSGQPLLVKTHEQCDDDRKAIYLVRDGRASLVSFHHFLLDFSKLRPSMEDVIRGTASQYGCWSEHVRSWSPKTRNRTLLIKYEDLVRDPQGQIDRTSAFLGLPQIAKFDRDFGSLRDVNGKFFRAGSNEENIAQLSPDQLDLFTQMHGQTMRDLGYF